MPASTTSKGSKRSSKALLASQRKPQMGPMAVLAPLLVAGTFALYSPLRTHAFVTYDDYDYVVNNSHVTAGLNWQTVRWALSSTEAANWHPVTWLSHAFDCQWFGLSPGPHHMVSVVIHALNALLLFLLLQRATGALGRSFVVAALFAWHPLSVESVSWVAERKNVLSTFFFLLTLGAYGWYVRRPRIGRYAVLVACFVLALASKPMVVTLPFVLLLLDYWPLQRIGGWTQVSERFPVPQQSFRGLLWEKLPLLVLSAASSVITVRAQGAAVQNLQRFPLGERAANAVLAYATYIWKAVWPARLAVLYPHPRSSLPFWEPASVLLVLCLISIVVWISRGKRSWLIVGWLWFLGTLVPVIGIVQVGEQAMADRYVYLPMIGLFAIAVWGSAEILSRRKWSAMPAWMLASVGLGALALLSFQQIGYWKDTLSLWSHASMVTPENATCERQLAAVLIARGATEQAVPHIYKLAKLDPNGVWTPLFLGYADLWQGRISEASENFEKSVKRSEQVALNPGDRTLRSSALLNLGITHLFPGNYPKALESFQILNRFDPAEVSELIESYGHALAADPSELSYVRLSLLLRAQGKDRDAAVLLESAVKANPSYRRVGQVLEYLNGSSSRRTD